MLTRAEFFDVANAVLIETGRGELPSPKKGDQRTIITVNDDDRVLQILAGPGSGKTEMLVWRVLYDLCVVGTSSESVMVTTFTRRAATELNVRVVERADQLLAQAHARGLNIADPQVHNIRIGTIHSLCDSLLAEFDNHYMAAGTVLIDEVEVVARLAREIRLTLGFNSSGPPRTVNRLLACQPLVALLRSPWETNLQWPSSQMDRISFVQDLLNQQIETWHPRCASANTPNGIEVLHGATGLTLDLCRLQQRWEDYLDAHQVLDFATIQKRFLAVQPKIRGHIRHVFVDEFQDNNPIQFAIHTGWLANPNTRLTVVGDDDQALYRFRGSDLACFADLERFCGQNKIAYRQAKLEENFRSTKRIVGFSQAFRGNSVLSKTSMQKDVREAPKAILGKPVRLLQGPWDQISQCVADELYKLGAGRIPNPGDDTPASAAVLMFSTSERSAESAARKLREAIELKSLRTFNPRKKTAADTGSPVADLIGLISYLIDPVSSAPAGKGGRPVMVFASSNDKNKASFALSESPQFGINDAHITFQKKFRGINRTIGSPPADLLPILTYVDSIRRELVAACTKRTNDSKSRPRLSLAGLVSRILSDQRYRQTGFTENLFRQALFTNLLEAHTAPTRRTMDPLDAPLEVTLNAEGKYVWPARYWSFLNVCGSYLSDAALDDQEIEILEQHAVLLLTFHQAKGLEFDHVYVAGTGRPVDFSPVLRTMLFSGRTPQYAIDPNDGTIHCNEVEVSRLAESDRDREVYVALTRARSHLTVLHDPSSDWSFLTLNPVLEKLFKGTPAKSHPASTSVKVMEYAP